MNLAQQLQLALEHHQAGRLAEAEGLYSRVIDAAPHSVDAWKLLGVVVCQRGDFRHAIECLRRSVELSNRRDVSALTNLAEVYRRAGWLVEARSVLREALQVDANLPETWNNLGTIHKSTGDLDAAEAAYRKAIAIAPAFVEAWNNLGTTLHLRGRFHEAEQCLLRVSLDPRFQADVLFNLGLVKRSAGQLDEAARYFDQLVSLHPARDDGWFMLGLVRYAQGRFDLAEPCLRRAVALRPDRADALNNLGLVRHLQGQHVEAVEWFRRALAVRPDDPETHNNLGAVLNDLGQTDAAQQHFLTALRHRPDFAEAHNNLGLLCLRQLGDFAQAERHLEFAIQCRPNYAEAYDHLGVLRLRQGRLTAARQLYEQALIINPASAETHNNLGNLLLAMGDAPEARVQYDAALRLKPGFAAAESNRLMGLLYDPAVTLPELLVEHAAWGDRVASTQPRFTAWPQSRDPDRQLRVGFVSSDLGQHPVGFILLPLVEQLDREQFHVTCYSHRRCHDPIEQRLKHTVGQWRDVVGMHDAALVEQIRADQIDVLFDLSGHTALNRLAVFAARPAPVQVTWAGYPATTGLATIDCLFTDRHLVPSGSEAQFREQVVCLPEAAWCCAIVAEQRHIEPGPTRQSGPLTLGSFNNPAKLSQPVVQLWSQILHAVPDARLILKFRGLDDEQLSERLREKFAAHGIAPARIECRGPTTFETMLHEYHDVDVALDPFPFGGGITSLLALWMGVPVVTLPGSTIASRQTLSILTAAGVTDTIARDEDDYVNIVTRLAGDRTELERLRRRLRPSVEQSAFMQAERFAPAWSAAVRQIWSQWCRSKGGV
ncbi:MAG: tetratricopeptide repeat protein [Planctomycetaceae bacterium]|nr:tetratricopeptide repeat protein [Planctomycetaceae bacterium]